MKQLLFIFLLCFAGYGSIAQLKIILAATMAIDLNNWVPCCPLQMNTALQVVHRGQNTGSNDAITT